MEFEIKMNSKETPNELVLLKQYISILCPTLLTSSSHLQPNTSLHQVIFGSLVALQTCLGKLGRFKALYYLAISLSVVQGLEAIDVNYDKEIKAGKQ